MAQTSIITFSGKLDNLVGFRTSKGGYAIRKHLPSVKQPNTQKQIDARTKFLATIKAAETFRNALDGLVPFARQNRINVRNAFVKLNRPLAVAENNTAFITPDQLILAKGNALAPVFDRPSAETPKQVTINWTNPEGTSDDDAVYGIAYSPELEIAFLASTKQTNDSLDITLPATVSGTKVHVYAFAQRFNTTGDAYTYWKGIDEAQNGRFFGSAEARVIASNSNFSDSQYLGEVTVG